MGAGMRITTHNRHTRQCGTLLRPDDVNDTLPQIIHLELRNAKGGAVLIQSIDLKLGDGVSNPFGSIRCWHVVVRDGEVGRNSPYWALCQA